MFYCTISFSIIRPIIKAGECLLLTNKLLFNTNKQLVYNIFVIHQVTKFHFIYSLRILIFIASKIVSNCQTRWNTMICRLRLFYISDLHHPSKTFIMIPDDACTAIRKVRKENSIVLFLGKRKVKVKYFKVSLKMHFNKSNKNALGRFLRQSSNWFFMIQKRVMAHHMYVPSYNFLLNWSSA